MALECGIVGLPNVGKSTIFSALTSAPASAENFPFCTIDPNIGIVDLPDERLDFLASKHNPKKKTPAAVKFVDIAGLIKGASQGEGLGNKFLANIRETDAIIHVLRCFDDPNVVHVDGSVNPIRDKEIIELRYGLNGKKEMTQKEVANLLGISQSYISRIEKKVIKKLSNIIKL